MSLELFLKVGLLRRLKSIERQSRRCIIKATICLFFHPAAKVPRGQKCSPQVPVMHQQFCLKFISSLLHADLARVLLPVAEILMQPILAKKLQLHQPFEKVSLPPPFLQRHKTRSLPIEIRHSPRADCYVLVSCHTSKLNDAQVIGMLASLQVAKFVAETALFFH